MILWWFAFGCLGLFVEIYFLRLFKTEPYKTILEEQPTLIAVVLGFAAFLGGPLVLLWNMWHLFKSTTFTVRLKKSSHVRTQSPRILTNEEVEKMKRVCADTKDLDT